MKVWHEYEQIPSGHYPISRSWEWNKMDIIDRWTAKYSQVWHWRQIKIYYWWQQVKDRSTATTSAHISRWETDKEINKCNGAALQTQNSQCEWSCFQLLQEDEVEKSTVSGSEALREGWQEELAGQHAHFRAVVLLGGVSRRPMTLLLLVVANPVWFLLAACSCPVPLYQTPCQ